jgi:dienelactone hydrolase
MADVVLFHHIHGLTDGMRAFADELRAAGHEVSLPDLFDGNVFDTIEDGMAYEEQIGSDTFMQRATEAADGLPAGVVYGGFSLGAMPAQLFAQTRSGAGGALLYHGAIPLGEWGFPAEWPAGVPVQMHIMADDPFEDLPAMQAIAAAAPDEAELYTYDGDQHLFTDPSLDVHDPEAARLVIERTLEFLARSG